MILEKDEELSIFDGAIGTEVQKRVPGRENGLTDLLNLTQPETIKTIHKDYLGAGAQFLTTNTFSSNGIRLSRSGHGEKAQALNETGASLAKKAIEEFSGKSDEHYIAGSMGPTGETLVPLGDWTFDQFEQTFHAQAKALKNGGADCIIIETMESLREATAALVAARQVGLPVITSLSYGDRGRTSYGVVPESGAATLDYLGADVLAMNCGTGPEPYPEIIKKYSRMTSRPLLAEANAGNPRLEEREAIYDMDPKDYLRKIKPGLPFLSGVGSCCGSDPGFTEVLAGVASEYSGKTKTKLNGEERYFTNNSGVVGIHEEVEFEEIHVRDDDLTNLNQKIIPDHLNMFRFSQFTESPVELEKVLARQFLQLRSINPLGIVTGEPELLEAFLKAYPGVSPVKATKNEESLRTIAKKYGGIII